MRGEGNHKIPGSFAPENMEKTGAERVKYSPACQHEDAIPIKFVSYAQKCPTVLCTFAVALRKESVDRNAGIFAQCVHVPRSLSARRAWIEIFPALVAARKWTSLSARRAWIEIILWNRNKLTRPVALRKESVDRNVKSIEKRDRAVYVALRKESVDRNTSIDNLTQGVFKSLSARRAWIEM